MDVCREDCFGLDMLRRKIVEYIMTVILVCSKCAILEKSFFCLRKVTP